MLRSTITHAKLRSSGLWIVILAAGCGTSTPSPSDPCSAVTCETPPPSACLDATTLRAYPADGSCVEGRCRYLHTDTICADGCEKESCKGVDSCSGVACISPPGASCDDTTLRTYSPSGTCANGVCSYAMTETTCPTECKNNACVGDPCAGLTCNQPPAAECLNADTLRNYATVGNCSNGACSYAAKDSTCTHGCEAGSCKGDPCQGVSCDQAPSPACVDATTRRAYDATGTCQAGLCSYVANDSQCAHGCTAGLCDQDPCAGVDCDTPPASTCLDATTLRTYPSGVCSQGACTYDPVDTTCPGGCVNSSCKGASSIAPYPGVTPQQIDSGTAQGLRISPDEKHVLVQRSVDTQSWGKGALAVVTVGPGGVGKATELTTAVRFVNGRPQAGFSADSKGLYFIDVTTNPVSKLIAANADGSGMHSLHSGAVQRTWIANNTLLYLVDGPNHGGDRELWAVVLPAGNPVKLVAAGDVYYPQVALNATGSAVVVWDQSGAKHQLIQTATAASVTLSAGMKISGAQWSPDGERFAYWNVYSKSDLHIVLADGTGEKLLASAAVAPQFSPDGAYLAYSTNGAVGWLGSTTLVSFSSAPAVTLSPDAAYDWSSVVAFSPDSERVVFTGGTAAVLAVGSVAGGNAITLSTDAAITGGYLPPRPYEFSPAHDWVAITEKNRTVSVISTNGGTATKLSLPVDHTPFYEEVAADPQLLVFTSPNGTQSGIFGSVALYPTDGKGPATVLPGQTLPAFVLSQVSQRRPFGWRGSDGGLGQVAQPFTWGWFGSAIIYEARTLAGFGFDVVAATDDASTIGVIAPGARVWAVRDGDMPTRVFYIPASLQGVWQTTLPQTPGRQ